MTSSSDISFPLDIKNDNNVILEPGDSELARLALSFAVVEHHLQHMFHSLVIAPIDLSTPGLRILDQACADGKL